MFIVTNCIIKGLAISQGSLNSVYVLEKSGIRKSIKGDISLESLN